MATQTAPVAAAGQSGSHTELRPFHTYIWKIASRCNLNCTYCFVYNLGDNGWQRQPKLMTKATAAQAARQIRAHCEALNKSDIQIVFHGGEPLLGGLKHLRELLSVIETEFSTSTVTPHLGMQTNGLLFTEDIGDYLRAHHVSVGISVDGPPDINDLHRVDLHGRPSSARLEVALELLSSSKYRDIFSGFLVVINLDADPIRIFEYLAQFHPDEIDFILPYDNWQRRPQGKEDFHATPYADWLIRLFDFWYRTDGLVRIREFDSILRLLLGASSLVESIGIGPVDLVVVETNGEIEAVDSLKGAFNGATALGLNVFEHNFDEASNHVAIRSRQLGATSLCSTCQTCPVVDYCGGGYLPNRYSEQNGFDNPSIYCRDLEKLIRHIHATVRPDLERCQHRG